MQIFCKSCGKTVPVADVNLELAIAKCVACNSVFGFLDQIRPEDLPSMPRDRPPAESPANIAVEDLGGELHVTRRWYSPAAWFLLLFCVVWDGFLVVWFTISIGSGAWPMALFGSIHAAVGVGLTYGALAMFINRSTLRVSRGALTIRHGPLPWWGNVELATANLKQLYCSEHTHRGKHGVTFTYNLDAVDAQGKRVTLLSGLPEIQQAVFIEQRVEQHLGIRDEAVPGEHRL